MPCSPPGNARPSRVFWSCFFLASPGQTPAISALLESAPAASSAAERRGGGDALRPCIGEVASCAFLSRSCPCADCWLLPMVAIDGGAMRMEGGASGRADMPGPRLASATCLVLLGCSWSCFISSSCPRPPPALWPFLCGSGKASGSISSFGRIGRMSTFSLPAPAVALGAAPRPQAFSPAVSSTIRGTLPSVRAARRSRLPSSLAPTPSLPRASCWAASPWRRGSDFADAGGRPRLRGCAASTPLAESEEERTLLPLVVARHCTRCEPGDSATSASWLLRACLVSTGSAVRSKPHAAQTSTSGASVIESTRCATPSRQGRWRSRAGVFSDRLAAAGRAAPRFRRASAFLASRTGRHSA